MKSKGKRGWRKAGHRGFSYGYRKNTLWASIAQHYVKIHSFMSLKYSFMRYLYWHLYPKKDSNTTISAHKESSAVSMQCHTCWYTMTRPHMQGRLSSVHGLSVYTSMMFLNVSSLLYLPSTYLKNCVEQWATTYCCLPRTNVLNTSLCIIHHSRLTFWTPPHGSK